MSSNSPQKKRPRPPSSSRSQAVAVEAVVVKRKMEKEDADFIGLCFTAGFSEALTTCCPDVDGEGQEDSSSDSS